MRTAVQMADSLNSGFLKNFSWEFLFYSLKFLPEICGPKNVSFQLETTDMGFELWPHV